MLCELYHKKCLKKKKNSLKPNPIFIYSSISQRLPISHDPSLEGVIKEITEKTGFFPQDPGFWEQFQNAWREKG